MKKTLFHLALATVCSLALISCKKSDDPAPSPSNPGTGPNSGDITFLRVGATSTYDMNTFFGSDTVYSVVEQEVAKDTFLIRNYSASTIVGPSQYLTLTNNTLYTSYRLRDKAGYEALCKFDKPVGTSWSVYRNGTLYYTATIDSLNAKIMTGKGLVTDAIKVKLVTASNSTSYQYYSRTIGVLGLGTNSSAYFLKDYTTSNAASTAPSQLPAITFGNLPFLTVGNYWNYSYDSFSASDSLKLTVVSKDANNIYKMKIRFKSQPADIIEYWYEDNGYLMAYQTGETLYKADAIYMKPSAAAVNYGWVGYSGTTAFVYRISSLNETATSTRYGSLPCMAIDVYSGLFSSQVNYWNADKGEVYVDGGGIITQDLVNSNVRQSSDEKIFIAGVTI